MGGREVRGETRGAGIARGGGEVCGNLEGRAGTRDRAKPGKRRGAQSGGGRRGRKQYRDIRGSLPDKRPAGRTSQDVRPARAPKMVEQPKRYKAVRTGRPEERTT